MVMSLQGEEDQTGFIAGLHALLTMLFCCFVLGGSAAMAAYTHQFWEDNSEAGPFAPGPLCFSESLHSKVALGNTFFGFFLPLALSMSWYAYRPKE